MTKGLKFIYEDEVDFCNARFYRGQTPAVGYLAYTEKVMN